MNATTQGLIDAIHQAKNPSPMTALLHEIHGECLRQYVREPSDLRGVDAYLADFLRLEPDVAGDYLNTGELPTLNDLVADLFVESKADPLALVVALKGHMRKHGLALLDAKYADALNGGLFGLDDVA